MRAFRFIVALVLLGLACAARAQESVWPGESWPVSSAAEEGVDPAAIAALTADIEAGKYGLVDHFLLIRHGRVVSDRHFVQDYETIAAQHDSANHQYNYDHPDWHPYYADTKLHTLQSVTKSITSICIGIAPEMSFFRSYDPDMSDPRRRDMTLEDMLTMRSGIDWNEMISYDDEANSCIQLEASDEWIRFVLDRPMREDPGTRFDYNSGVSVLLGKIVRVATGKRIDEYAREKLFTPLGIDEFYWKITPDGEADTEGGLYLSAHDLARIAYLFLRKGEWNGKRIVSEAWVEASVRPHVTLGGNGRPARAYGYQWWVPQHADGRPTVYQGSGYGGQFPIVVPHLDLVVVFNAWNIHDRPKLSTQAAVGDIIIPATRDSPRPDRRHDRGRIERLRRLDTHFSPGRASEIGHTCLSRTSGHARAGVARVACKPFYENGLRHARRRARERSVCPSLLQASSERSVCPISEASWRRPPARAWPEPCLG
ncbi:MAG: serine hydrolase domain-containing protein [Planctomycetota bacterium]